MPTYTLTAGMLSSSAPGGVGTYNSFAGGELEGFSCDITATTDGNMADGTPWPPTNNASGQGDIIDIGSTMDVDGTSFTIIGEVGGYSDVTYDDNGTIGTFEGNVTTYELSDGVNPSSFISFVGFNYDAAPVPGPGVDILGFEYTDIGSGTDLGLLPTYEDQGMLEWGAPDGVKPPCFTAGMEIETARGTIKVEDLVPGDLIETFDNGLQEVKYISRRQVLALGDLQPVIFDTGAIGNTKPLIVSQKHRMFVGALPEEMKAGFGKHTDVLIQAVELCNGGSIRLATGMKHVEYFHLMFDDHQLVFCHGTVSESWQPTRAALKKYPELAEELTSIFPGIANRRAHDSGAQVRMEVTKDPQRRSRVA